MLLVRKEALFNLLALVVRGDEKHQCFMLFSSAREEDKCGYTLSIPSAWAVRKVLFCWAGGSAPWYDAVVGTEPAAPDRPTGDQTMATETVQQKIARLEAENAVLKAKAAARSVITFKVSEKGGLSVYGLGRFPVTLYVGQWERLLGRIDDLRAFIVDSGDKLSRKE